MVKWSNTHNNIHIILSAQLNKSSQVEVPIPIKVSFGWFVKTPKNICSYKSDATSFHFLDFLIPLICRITAEVELTKNRNDRFSITLKIVTIYYNLISIRVYSSKF